MCSCGKKKLNKETLIKNNNPFATYGLDGKIVTIQVIESKKLTSCSTNKDFYLRGGYATPLHQADLLCAIKDQGLKGVRFLDAAQEAEFLESYPELSRESYV